MAFVKIIENFIEEVREAVEDSGDTLIVSETFEDDVREPLSCILHVEGTDRFGVVSVNVEAETDGEEVNCFIFNGRLYDYCRMEGFTRTQMIEDATFEDKVITRKTKQQFIDAIASA